MGLVNRFYLKDIREYEDSNNVNIIHFFDDTLNLTNLIELIKIGTHKNTEQACDILQVYLEDPNNNMESAYIEIRDVLLGKQVSEGDNKNLDAKEYNSLTDLFSELCSQMLSMGISYSEFWGMNTKEMYKVADGLKDKQVIQFNEDIAKNHILAGMVGAAVWGKLGNKPPQIEVDSEDDIDDEVDSIYIEGLGEMTAEEYQTYKKLKRQGG